MIAALGENRLDPILFAERLALADDFNLQRGLGSQPLGVGADLDPLHCGRFGYKDVDAERPLPEAVL